MEQHTIINSFPAHIALLDCDGMIISVNDDWKNFPPAKIDEKICEGIGINYREVCRTSSECCSEEGDTVARGVANVLSGQMANFSHEYRCNLSANESWLRVSATPILDEKRNINGAMLMFLDITEEKIRQIERQQLLYDLGERVKELTGLHGAALLLRQDDLPIETVIKKFAELMPPAWQYPEHTGAFVQYGDVCHQTSKFSLTPWIQEQSFRTRDGKKGCLKVSYDVPMPAFEEGPFFKEERNLINSLAELLCSHLDRRIALERLRASEEQYRFLFEKNPNPMWVFDKETEKFLAVNETAIEKYGYGRQEFLDISVSHLRVKNGDDDKVSFSNSDEVNPCGFRQQQSHRLKNGQEIWVDVHARNIQFRGRPACLASAVDVTKQRKAQLALLESESRFRRLLESVGDGIRGIDLDGNIIFENPAAQLLLESSKSQNIGKHDHELIHHHHADGRPYPKEDCPVHHTMQDGKTRRVSDDVYFRADGSSFPVEYTCAAIKDERGVISGAVIVFKDISERIQLLAREQEALKAADAASRYYRSLFEYAPGNYVVLTPDEYRIVGVSQAYLDATKTTREQLYGKCILECFSSDPQDPHVNAMANLKASLDRVKATNRADVMSVQKHPIRLPQSEGGDYQVRYWNPVSCPVPGPDGQLAFILHRVEDVTDYFLWKEQRGEGEPAKIELASRQEMLEADIVLRSNELRKANEQLAESQALLKVASKLSKVGGWRVTLPEMIIHWSDEVRKIHEVPFDYLPSLDEAINFYLPEYREIVSESFKECLQNGTPFEIQCQLLSSKGNLIWVCSAGEAVRNEQGEIIAVHGAFQDITEQKIAVERIRASEERFRLVARATKDAIWDWDTKENSLWWSEGLRSLFGYEMDDDIRTVESWRNLMHSDDKERVLTKINEVDETAQDFYSVEYRFRRKNGTHAEVLERGFLIRDDAGRVVRIIGAMSDMTEIKSLQAQLAQSQKMEAIGQLAGGVAHDFNNLLTIITGFTEFVVATLPAESDERSMLGSVLDAANRATNLTRQLLAFSRKQLLSPQIVDLNQIVENLQKMLGRLIGEDIVFNTILDPRSSQIKVDPGQIEQVIINLAVNARDAMPQGGRLTIETRNIVISANQLNPGSDLIPGNYIEMSITDTGTGMGKDTMDHIFEPFFTTKDLGKGTGLGLATVFGIIKQSDAYIDVKSQLGKGTTFRILFPAVREAAKKSSPLSRLAKSGNERVLLVEDEDSVRKIVRMALENYGYTVLEASNGKEALSLFRKHSYKINLLITDVVMPEMSGRELVEILRESTSDIKVLYMSGYTDDAIVRHGIVDSTDAFIQKPFSPLKLARTVRNVMDGIVKTSEF